jgi:glycosyltransferase involved in cell wall biosynthesis
LKRIPEISVILPTFNRRKKILRAIDSVINQSYNNFELIVVDDGSTDNTGRVINPLLNNFPNIKYLYHSNRGTANSLNAGIMLAEGKYITFIDSDDEYETEHLKLRINFFRKNKRVDLIHTTCRFIGRENDMYVPDARNIKRLIHLKDCIIGATFFGKKEVFTKLKGFKNVYSYDSDFYKRANRIYIVKKVDFPTYIYYRNSKDSNLTSIKNKIISNEKQK